MTKNVLLGLGIIAAGLLTILRRRRIASDSARHKETWMADHPDVDRLASSLGVIGWILVGFGLLVLILGVTLARSSPGGSIAEFSLEVPSPAIRQDRLTEAVGFETLGGVFTAVLMPCALPCEKTEILSTAVDNQQRIALHVFRGNGQSTSDAHLLGHVAIRGLPPQPRGTPQIEVTLRAEAKGLVLSVRERGGARLTIEQLDQ